MTRRNIHISDKLWNAATKLGQRKGVSASHIIREGTTAHIRSEVARIKAEG